MDTFFYLQYENKCDVEDEENKRSLSDIYQSAIAFLEYLACQKHALEAGLEDY